MRNLNKLFENKTIDYDKLLDYGFSKKDDNYTFEINISDNHFKVVVEISESKYSSRVIDLSMNEEYILVDVQESSGEYVGKVKEEYESILNDIIDKCTTPNVFKSKQSKEVINYIKEKYNDDLEYLWKKFPNNAIWRNKSNNKWYGAILQIPESKLGINSEILVDVIDLRYQKDIIKGIIDNIKVFEGYHMNKNSWITIKLDGTVELSEIYKLIDNSYELSLKK